MLEHVAAEAGINVEWCKLLVAVRLEDILRQYPDVFV